MKNISKFSPAETLMLLKFKEAELRDLLKVTFMDLLLKKVIKTIELSQKSNSRDKARVLKYIVIGKNFYTYIPKPHETVFMNVFAKSSSVRILFKHMVRMGYQNAKSQNYFQIVLSQNPNLQEHFSRSLFQKIFGGYSITSQGQEMQSKLNEEITILEKNLPDYIVNDKAKALDILKQIGGNIFILKNIDFNLLFEIDKELMAEINRENKKENDSSYSGYDWYSYDYDSADFDNSCSGDSGCSGGGDGGCSGCGGCGGCGGD